MKALLLLVAAAVASAQPTFTTAKNQVAGRYGNVYCSLSLVNRTTMTAWLYCYDGQKLFKNQYSYGVYKHYECRPEEPKPADLNVCIFFDIRLTVYVMTVAVIGPNNISKFHVWKEGLWE